VLGRAILGTSSQLLLFLLTWGVSAMALLLLFLLSGASCRALVRATPDEGGRVSEVHLKASSELFNHLALHAMEPPRLHYSENCSAPPIPLEVSCSQTAFTGTRASPRQRIAHMFLFSWEVDTLEILLMEEFEIVERFFLVESVHAQHLGIAKPLLWERLKSTTRFKRFEDKIVHIVIDDTHSGKMIRESLSGNHWAVEDGMTQEAVKSVMQWQEEAGSERFGPGDIFISGDVDEVLSRKTLNELASCALKHTVVSGALWMPMGDLRRAFITDHPVSDRPHSFAMPTIYQFSELTAADCCGRRFTNQVDASRSFANLPHPDAYVVGGVHLTSVTQPVQMILKALSNTEAPGEATIPADLDAWQLNVYASQWADRCVPLSELSDYERTVVFTPWWLECNPGRFPAWYGVPDERNAKLRKRLLRLKANSRHS